uniref:uncharacterized protein LOC120336950 isoform X1 n=1 Tax=Styela clava TaxID=7725 RepID=UPI00193AB3ED|nr:uncharacterized protein LOC120336950 isoform X1 [Styela clava]
MGVMDMEVSVIGKAFTPVPHHEMAQFDLDSKQQHKQPTCLSFQRCHSDNKLPLKLCLEPRLRNRESWISASYNDKSCFDLGPTFRSLTLAETYNFARPQLTSNPAPRSRQTRNFRSPVLAYTKTINSNVSDNQAFGNADIPLIESTRSAAPLISCRTKETEAQHKKSNLKSMQNKKEDMLMQSLNRRYSRSVCGFRKQRKKSGFKRKTDNETNKASKNKSDCLPAKMAIPLLPPKTQQSSFSMLRNIYDKDRRENRISEHEYSKRNHDSNTSSDKRMSLVSQSLSRRSQDSSLTKSDSLLFSLDSELSRKSKRQLSMRIQLIHRYGDEDVITKHMEMKKKQENADKHERKILAMKANERLKEQQRSKIYALNTLMTKLEQEQFQEYKQSS